jgi:hypothetical protein
VEDLACLMSGRTDSITRESLSALFDFARYAVGDSGPDELGLGEVEEPVNALGVEAPQ